MSGDYTASGRLKVDVVAELRGFSRDLKNKVDRAARGSTAKIEVEPAGDGFRDKLRELVASAARGITAQIEVEIDSAGLREKLEAVADEAGAGKGIPLKVSPELSDKAVAALRAKVRILRGFLIATLGTIPIGLHLDEKSIAELHAKLAVLLHRRDIDIGFDKRGFGLVQGGLLSTIGKMTGLGVVTRSLGPIFTSTLIGVAVPALAAAAQAAIALIGVLAQAVVGAAALAPAFIAAAGVGLGTIIIATRGIGDAFKALASGDAAQLQAALKNLAPSAREFVLQLAFLKPILTDLRTQVQQAFFTGLGPAISGLARIHLPALRAAMVSVAGDMSASIRGLASDMSTAGRRSDLQQIFTIAGQAAGRFFDLIRPLASVFTDLGAAGLPILDRVSTTIQRVAFGFAQWISQLRASGQLTKFLDTAVATLSQLGRILANLGGGLVNVFAAGQAAGGGLLGTLERLSGAFLEFTSSTQGQAALAGFFGSMARIGSALIPLLSTAASIIGTVIAPALADFAVAVAPGLGQLLDGLKTGLSGLAPVMGIVGQAVGAIGGELGRVFAVLGPALADGLRALAPAIGPLAKGIGDILVAASPLLPVIGQLANWIGTLLGGAMSSLAPLVAIIAGALQAFFGPAVKTAATLLQVLLRALQPMIGGAILPAIASAFAEIGKAMATAGAALITGLLPYLPQITAMIQQAIPFIVQAISILGDGFAKAITAITPHLPQIGAAIGQIAVAFYQVYLALAPLLPQIAQLFVDMLSDPENMDALVTVINLIALAMVGFAKSIVGAIPLIMMLARLVLVGFKAMFEWWGLMVQLAAWPFRLISAFASAVATMVSFFAALPGRASAAIQSLVGAVGSIITATWNTAKSVTAAGVALVVTWFSGLPAKVISVLGSLAGRIRSVFSQAMSAAASAISAGVSAIAAAAGRIASRVADAAKDVVGRMRRIGSDIVQGIVDGISNSLGAVKAAAKKIADAIPGPIRSALGIHSPSRVAMWIGDMFGAGLTQSLIAAAGPVSTAALGLASAMTPGYGAGVLPVRSSGAAAAAATYSGGITTRTAAATGSGGNATISVYPSQGMDEVDLARKVAREWEWAL